MSDPLILTVTACGLLTAPALHLVATGWANHRIALRADRFRSRQLTKLRQAAEIARLNSELQSAPVGSSLAWRVLEVADVLEESVDCRSYYLVDPYQQTLPDFLPGQHVLIRPAMSGANSVTRCYSLSAAPDPRYWRITVKRQAADAATQGAGHQGGLSGWLHAAIAPGDCLLVGGPMGGFTLTADNPRPLVLVAAGVGITPMASMLLWSIQHTPQRPVALVYQAQDDAHWPLGRSLHQAQSLSANSQVHTYFSRAESSSVAAMQEQLPGHFFTGRVGGAPLVQTLPYDDCDYFLCGPARWMDSLRDELISAGVQTEHIHWESFGARPVKPVATHSDSCHEFAVTFQRSRVEAMHHDPEQTVWELAREHQVDIPSGCLSGVCGSCKVRLLSGSVEYSCPVGFELAGDECLSCIARPTSPVVIDA